jgi:hypothetical protein
LYALRRVSEFGGLGGRAGDEERERDKQAAVNIDFARSKAPWGWEALRGESEARLLDGKWER